MIVPARFCNAIESWVIMRTCKRGGADIFDCSALVACRFLQ